MALAIFIHHCIITRGNCRDLKNTIITRLAFHHVSRQVASVFLPHMFGSPIHVQVYNLDG